MPAPFQHTFRHKLRLALVLNAFFYGVLMWVNLRGEDRAWDAIVFQHWAILLSEYLVGCLAILGWLYLAEWVHQGFERYFGEDTLSKGGVWPNVAAFLVCSVLVVGINLGLVQLIYWLQTQLLERADATIRAQNAYAQAALRFGQVVYVFMAMLVYYLLSFRRVMQRLREATERAESAQKQQAEAEYQALRHRVNPHFLFNSLSTLSSLVHLDTERSEQFIEHLSKAYRYLLETRDRDTVPLQAELDFMHAYAFLQKMRFDAKLRIETDIAPQQAQPYQLLPHTLQSLVERAMRHNRLSAQSPLIIRIFLKDNALHVENNRQRRTDPDLSLGPSNWETLEKRYAQWAGPGQITFDQPSDTRWLTRVPLRSAEAASHQPSPAP